jgi:hypothetical protein
MKNKIFIPLILLFFFFACSKKSEDIKTGQQRDEQNAKTTEEVKEVDKDALFESVQVKRVDISTLTKEDLRKKLNDVYDQYSEIRDELSDDDQAGVKKQALKLRKTLLDTKTEAAAEGEYDNEWDNLVYSMETIALKMEMSKELADQRALFSELSTVMENMIKTFGVYDKTVYKLNCTTIPDKLWLTDSKELKNPYYGKDGPGENDEKCIQVTEAWEFD